MRHKRLNLLGVEEIEGPFRDQHDRASVQSHGGLGHLNDLDDVDRFPSVQFEYAPHGSELLQLSCIQVVLVAPLPWRRDRAS